MKTAISAIAAAIVLVSSIAIAGFASSGRSATAEEHALPGMCNGRNDANTVLIAHANGTAVEVPKFILNLYTGPSGPPEGVLILGKGSTRLKVEEWCRLWQHRPGDEPGGGGQCEEGDEGHDPNAEGAQTAHAVGIGWTAGVEVLVRVDVRSNEEGMFFRVRYRPLAHEHEEVAIAEHEDDGGCEGGEWTRVPVEGWAPLDQMKLHALED